MKTIGYFLLSALCFLSLSCGNKEKGKATQAPAEASGEPDTKADERGYIVKVGDDAPDFALTTLTGETIRLSEQRGRIVMLQFTASWCSVCRKEMPFIEREIWQKYKDRTDFVLWGIDRDEPQEKVRDFVRQTGVTYPMGLDLGADVFARYAERSAGITRNVIIDRQGRIVLLTRLYNEEEFASMCAKIAELLH